MFRNDLLTAAGVAARPPRDGTDENGRTLVEQLLILGIGGVLLAGSIVLGTQVYSNVTGNAGTQQLGALISNVRALYAGSAGYGNAAINPVLISANEVPPDMLVNGAIVNAWGGNVAVQGNNNTFTITFNGVPTAACVKLATMNLGTAGTTLTAVTINGNGQALPVTMAAATGANGCTQNSNANIIAWTIN
jgi:hypothetical protein